METRLPFRILPQPDETTCGPTCLHGVYQYHGDPVALEQVIAEVPTLEGGGTLGVFLACHALHRGYHATIYTYNLQVFDPTWFMTPDRDIAERLRRQMAHKHDARLHKATRGYLEFLNCGGELRFTDLTASLIRGYLKRKLPILTGLSATYLYRSAREYGPNDDYDDVRGEPAGHFVVLSGYDAEARQVQVSDPLHPNPVSRTHEYAVNIDRVIGSILLGILTHDANLVIIEPRRPRKAHR